MAAEEFVQAILQALGAARASERAVDEKGAIRIFGGEKGDTTWATWLESVRLYLATTQRPLDRQATWILQHGLSPEVQERLTSLPPSVYTNSSTMAKEKFKEEFDILVEDDIAMGVVNLLRELRKLGHGAANAERTNAVASLKGLKRKPGQSIAAFAATYRASLGHAKAGGFIQDDTSLAEECMAQAVMKQTDKAMMRSHQGSSGPYGWTDMDGFLSVLVRIFPGIEEDDDAKLTFPATASTVGAQEDAEIDYHIVEIEEMEVDGRTVATPTAAEGVFVGYAGGEVFTGRCDKCGEKGHKAARYEV